jgi:Tfp pilus assembly protein FimT
MPNLSPQPMPNLAHNVALNLALNVVLNKAYKSQCKQQGNTLLETLLVVSIMSLLMLGAIPSIKKILIQTDQAIALDRIKNAIEFAKNEAFRRNKTITLCPSINQNSCGYGESWELGYLLFENPARNTQPTVGSIIQVFSGARYGKIIYNATGNQLYIHADGTTNNIGNFIYCPKDKNIIKPKGLVLNWVARIYPAEENPDKPIGFYCY